jgi:outer membrane protein assembly factor BamB
MFTRNLRRAAAALLITVSTQAASVAQDWPQWRGPRRDGAAAAFKSPKQWPEKLTLKWRVPVGYGAASPVLAGGRIYLLANDGKRETVTALALADGKQLWQDGYPVTDYVPNVYEKELSKGPKATPAYHAGGLYTVGVTGVISAYDAATGRLRWRRESKGGEKVSYPVFGMANSPLVAGDLLIAPVGGNAQSKLTAFDVKTGAVRWQWGAENLHPELGLGYSSPVLAEIGGAPQILFWSGRDLVGLAPETGKVLWQFPFRSQWDPVVTPVVHKGMVILSGNPMGTVAVRVGQHGGAWRAEQAWEQKDVFNYMNSPVVAGNLLFGMSARNKGQYYCLDASDGRKLWATEGREGENAAILAAGDSLLILTIDAKLIVARSTGAGFESVRRYEVASSPTWSHPVAFGDRLLIKDESNLTLWAL